MCHPTANAHVAQVSDIRTPPKVLKIINLSARRPYALTPARLRLPPATFTARWGGLPTRFLLNGGLDVRHVPCVPSACFRAIRCHFSPNNGDSVSMLRRLLPFVHGKGSEPARTCNKAPCLRLVFAPSMCPLDA